MCGGFVWLVGSVVQSTRPRAFYYFRVHKKIPEGIKACSRGFQWVVSSSSHNINFFQVVLFALRSCVRFPV